MEIKDQNDFMSSASPDGQTVVFTSGRSGVLRLYLMDADGANQRVITGGPGRQLQGSWSPDGKKIVYVQREDDDQYLMTINADGSDARKITGSTGGWPIASWSPDGTRILYNAPGPYGSDDIMSVAPDGGTPEAVLGSPETDRHAWWSPDGDRIVFSSRRDGNDYEIFVADVAGGEWIQITDNQVNDFTPSWSPDGSKIVFQSYRGGRWTIVSVNADGSDQTPLTHYPTQWDPGWSYDGTKIFFNSERDGRRGIYVMNADGSHQRKLTNVEQSSFLSVVREAGVDEAVRLFRKSRAANPSALYFYEREVQNLGENYLEMRHLRKAILLFEVNAESYPDSKSAFKDLGMAHYAAGKINEAIQSYERASVLDPADEQIPRLIQQLRTESGVGM